MKNSKIRTMCLMSLYVALAVCLEYFKESIPFINMPQGGSINIPLIPLVLGSIQFGFLKGCLMGFLWWLITTILALNYPPISVLQYSLDYIIPSLSVGVVGFYKKNDHLVKMYLLIFLSMVIRYLCNLFSGAIYYFPKGEASNSLGAWIFSFEYNTPYNLATLLLLLFVCPLLYKRLKSFL